MAFPQIRTIGRLAFSGRTPLHLDEDFRPVYIVGAGRSGTTLMRRLLVEGGEIHIPPEIFATGPAINKFRALCSLSWDWLVHIVLAEFQLTQGASFSDTSLAPLAARLATTPPEERSLASIIDSIYRFHGESTGFSCPRWGDKTPLNSYILEDIRAVFPRARFIHMLRDGRDVVASWMHMGRFATLEEAASRWSSATASVRAFSRRHPESCLEVHYASLVNDPLATLRQVCSFVGISFRDEMTTSTKVISDDPEVNRNEHLHKVVEPLTNEYVKAPRRELTSEEMDRLNVLLGDQLRELGYS